MSSPVPNVSRREMLAVVAACVAMLAVMGLGVYTAFWLCD